MSVPLVWGGKVCNDIADGSRHVFLHRRALQPCRSGRRRVAALMKGEAPWPDLPKDLTESLRALWRPGSSRRGSNENVGDYLFARTEDLYNTYVVMASKNAALQNFLKLQEQDIVKRYGTGKLMQQLETLETLFAMGPGWWAPGKFLNYLTDLDKVAAKMIVLRRSLPAEVNIPRMINTCPSFLDVPDEEILTTFPQKARSLGKNSARQITATPSILLSEKPTPEAVPISTPSDAFFQAVSHAASLLPVTKPEPVKEPPDFVAQQLDRLLHPCPRRWSDLHQQQYTSPAYVAQRLVVLRTLFPDDVDVLRLVSVHPEILDAPDEMVQAFMSRVRPLG